jgi:hypothetical protein
MCYTTTTCYDVIRFMQDWAVAAIQRLVRGWLARRIVAAKAVEVKLSHRVAFLADKFVKKGCLDVWGFLQQVYTLRLRFLTEYTVQVKYKI